MYLFVDPTTRWKLSGGEWSNVTNVQEYNNLYFDTYVNNKPFGEFNVVFNEKFYLFDRKKLSHRFDGTLLAYRGNRKMKVIDYQEQMLQDIDYPVISQILNSNKITFPVENVSGTKMMIDLNNDGKKEKVYTLYNVFNEYNAQDIFAFIVVVDGSNIQYIYKKTDSVKNMIGNMCVPSIHSIIDLDEDKQYEIITNCTYFSKKGTCSSLYNNKKNNYKIMKGC